MNEDYKFFISLLVEPSQNRSESAVAKLIQISNAKLDNQSLSLDMDRIDQYIDNKSVYPFLWSCLVSSLYRDIFRIHPFSFNLLTLFAGIGAEPCSKQDNETIIFFSKYKINGLLD